MKFPNSRQIEGRRYLVLTELFLPTKGGTAVWFDEAYRRLGGKQIHVLTAGVPGDVEHDLHNPNSVHRLKLQDHPFLRPASFPKYLRFFLHGLWLGLRNDFEAVHAGRVLPEGLCAWAIARMIRRPLVIYAHGEEITTWRHLPRRLKAMRFAYRHADRVVANSDFTRDQLVSLGVRPDRITIINPGVDIERFRPDYETADLRARIGLAAGQKLIVSVGRLNRRKGFDTVIAALPRLVEQGIDVHHVIIGIGDDEDYLRQLAEKKGVSERVHLLGHVDSDDLPRWYCAADVFAMPNRKVNDDTEGFGMVYVEAAACGTPSIAGNAGGTGSAVLDGETGLRVDGDDLEAVTAALQGILADDAYAKELADAAERRARSELSWEQVAVKTAALD